MDAPKLWFAKAFELDSQATGIRLRTGADNTLELFLDGALVAVADDWARPVRMDLGASSDLVGQLGPGTHVLTAHCENEGGPAGFWLKLSVEQEANGPIRLVSDGAWTPSLGEPLLLSSDLSGKGLSAETPLAIEDLGALGTEPWGTPTNWSSGRPDQPIDPAELEIAPGFRVELVYAVPRRSQGSWVSMTFDAKGRLFASDQYGGLWRLTPGAGSDEARVEPVNVELGEAHGLAFVGDDLFAVVSGAGKYESGLYRATDTDRDGKLDSVEKLAAFDGTGEHGPHAVVPTKDGKGLWILAGNHTPLPDFIQRSRVPRLWAEDQLFASMDDPNGHAVGRHAPAGWLARCDFEGKHWELYASGMRNSFDVVENEQGDLLTFDADMEWDLGLPWYRPSRILHLVSGADFGWRTGSGKWPTYYLDTLPAVLDMGLTSPTGLTFGADTNFPAEWRERLFAGDWAYGTIYAIQLLRDGASYSGHKEVFVRGLPLPVTDLAVGKDGALWFTVGGRRAQSGVYRVVWNGSPSIGQDGPSVLIENANPLAAQVRRDLESRHRPHSSDAIEFAWPFLQHPDRHVRFAARVAIELQDVELWASRALTESHPRAAAQSLAALARTGAVSPAEFFDAFAAFDLALIEPSVQLEFLRALELGFLRLGWPLKTDALESFVSLVNSVPTGDAIIDHELTKLAVYASNHGLSGVDVLPGIVHQLECADTQEDVLTATLLLGQARTGWNEDLRRRAWQVLTPRAEGWSGGHSVELYAQALLDTLQLVAPSPFDSVGQEAVDQNQTPVGEDIVAAPFVKAWSLDELRRALEEDDQIHDLELGRRAYEKASCNICHRFDGDGGATGPDLTSVASRFGPRDLLRTIVLPSETIADQYQNEEVWTIQDELFLGRVTEEPNGSLTVHLASPEAGTVTLAPAEVDLRRPHALSPMPSGLVDVLTKEEILSLLAFLREKE